MMESLLTVNGNVSGDNCGIALPSNTGPGPTSLIGCYNRGGDQRGFFGEVSTSELISGTALASLINLTAGTAQNNDEPWLKFILDGRILFVSKKFYRRSISWDQINAVNAVFGDRVITIGGYQYRIGLLKGLGPDTSGFVGNTYDNPATHGSEWNRLMYNVAVADSRERGSQVGENWAEYTQDELITTGNGRISWCQETHPTDSSRRVYRGSSSVSYMSSASSSTATAFFGWRPRLELVL